MSSRKIIITIVMCLLLVSSVVYAGGPVSSQNNNENDVKIYKFQDGDTFKLIINAYICKNQEIRIKLKIDGKVWIITDPAKFKDEIGAYLREKYRGIFNHIYIKINIIRQPCTVDYDCNECELENDIDDYEPEEIDFIDLDEDCGECEQFWKEQAEKEQQQQQQEEEDFWDEECDCYLDKDDSSTTTVPDNFDQPYDPFEDDNYDNNNHHNNNHNQKDNCVNDMWSGLKPARFKISGEYFAAFFDDGGTGIHLPYFTLSGEYQMSKYFGFKLRAGLTGTSWVSSIQFSALGEALAAVHIPIGCRWDITMDFGFGLMFFKKTDAYTVAIDPAGCYKTTYTTLLTSTAYGTAGIGINYYFTKHFWMGLETRYIFTLTDPETNLIVSDQGPGINDFMISGFNAILKVGFSF